MDTTPPSVPRALSSSSVAVLIAVISAATVPGKDATSTSPILFVPAASAGNVAILTGCVACQNVPVTGTAEALN